MTATGLVRAARRTVRAASRGVWHFLVGDTPEFLPATVGIAVLGFVLRGMRPAAVVAVPGAVILVLVVSIVLWRRAARAGR